MITRRRQSISIQNKRQIIFQNSGIQVTIRGVDHSHGHHQHTVSACRSWQNHHLCSCLREYIAIPFERCIDSAHHTVGESHHIVYLFQINSHNTVTTSGVLNGLRINARYRIGFSIIHERQVILKNSCIQSAVCCRKIIHRHYHKAVHTIGSSVYCALRSRCSENHIVPCEWKIIITYQSVHIESIVI